MCTNQETESSMMRIKSPPQSPSPVGPFASTSPPGFPVGHPQHPPQGTSQQTPAGPNAITSLAIAEYQHRLQLYDYAQQAALRLRLTQNALSHHHHGANNGHHGPPSGPVFGHPALAEAGGPFGHLPHFARFDPRFRFMHEEPKPQHSYIGLIAMAILSNPEKKMVLSDIYQHILDHYPYFRNRGPGWRNSIRHNLSLNDCFIKSGRSANGKGHYWAIHPANIDDFTKGDFRRRKAQRKVRKHMGLSVPEDEDSNSPSSTPGPSIDGLGPYPILRQPASPHELSLALSSAAQHHHHHHHPHHHHNHQIPHGLTEVHFSHMMHHGPMGRRLPFPALDSLTSSGSKSGNKRMFDVESLLAPDSTVTESEATKRIKREAKSPSPSEEKELVDVETGNSCPSPRSTSLSPNHTESNCSSPSISSSDLISPQPNGNVNINNPHPKSNPMDPNGPISGWNPLQSLHNLQQMNAAGLLSRFGMGDMGGFSAWAASLAQHHHHHQQQLQLQQQQQQQQQQVTFGSTNSTSSTSSTSSSSTPMFPFFPPLTMDVPSSSSPSSSTSSSLVHPPPGNRTGSPRIPSLSIQHKV